MSRRGSMPNDNDYTIVRKSTRQKLVLDFELSSMKGFTLKDLENHIRKCKKEIVDFAETVSRDYVVPSIEPFSVKLLKVESTRLILQPSRPLSSNDVKVFERNYVDSQIDRFAGLCALIEKGDYLESLDLKRAFIQK